MPNENKDNLINPASKKASIKTVNEDIARALSGNNAREVKYAIDTAKERESIDREKTLASNKNKLAFGLTFLFLVIAVISFLFIYKRQNDSPDITVLPIYSGLISYESSKSIGDFETKPSITVKKIKESIGEIQTPGLTRLKFTNIDPVSSQNLISALGWKSNQKFINELENAFDIGVYVYTEGENVKKSPFVLFKTNGTDQAFAGFSLWESNILFDLNEVFGLNIENAYDPIYQKKFEPITISSHDGRVLYNKNKEIVVIMIFLDENHALITNSKPAVNEILKRVILNK